MRAQTFERRLERAEHAAKTQSKFSTDCICFPENEPPFFGFPLEQEIAAKVKCALHGDRFEPRFYIYVPDGVERTRRRSVGSASARNITRRGMPVSPLTCGLPKRKNLRTEQWC